MTLGPRSLIAVPDGGVVGFVERSWMTWAWSTEEILSNNSVYRVTVELEAELEIREKVQ